MPCASVDPILGGLVYVDDSEVTGSVELELDESETVVNVTNVVDTILVLVVLAAVVESGVLVVLTSVVDDAVLRIIVVETRLEVILLVVCGQLPAAFAVRRVGVGVLSTLVLGALPTVIVAEPAPC